MAFFGGSPTRSTSSTTWCLHAARHLPSVSRAQGVLGLAISVALALVMYRFVERPSPGCSARARRAAPRRSSARPRPDRRGSATEAPSAAALSACSGGQRWPRWTTSRPTAAPPRVPDGVPHLRAARPERGNAVLLVPWFLGTSRGWRRTWGPSLVDDGRFFVVAADTPGNGVPARPPAARCSPGATPSSDHRPGRAEKQLLTRALGIQHLRAVVGRSMGGMRRWPGSHRAARRRGRGHRRLPSVDRAGPPVLGGAVRRSVPPRAGPDARRSGSSRLDRCVQLSIRADDFALQAEEAPRPHRRERRLARRLAANLRPGSGDGCRADEWWIRPRLVSSRGSPAPSRWCSMAVRSPGRAASATRWPVPSGVPRTP